MTSSSASWLSIVTDQSTDLPTGRVTVRDWSGTRSVWANEFDTSCDSSQSRTTVDAHVSVHEIGCSLVGMIVVSRVCEVGVDVMHEDDMGVEWSTHGPVWVRSRSTESFPGGCFHHVAADYQIEVANLQAWREVKSPVVGSGPACDKILHHWNTWLSIINSRYVPVSENPGSDQETNGSPEAGVGHPAVCRSDASRIPFNVPVQISVVGWVTWLGPVIPY